MSLSVIETRLLFNFFPFKKNSILISKFSTINLIIVSESSHINSGEVRFFKIILYLKIGL